MTRIGKLEFCEHYVFSKQYKVSFGTCVHKNKDTLDYIYSDVWGPLKGGASYLLTLIDDYFRKVWVYPLKYKSNVFATCKQWKAMLEKQIGKKVKHLRTDNRMEFYSTEFDQF